jgi:hypothetical protein
MCVCGSHSVFLGLCLALPGECSGIGSRAPVPRCEAIPQRPGTLRNGAPSTPRIGFKRKIVNGVGVTTNAEDIC